ncbi:quinone oxidoreductase [Stenotrophomonas panacihumi]|uniref:Quinone oxidoreductase n=1 Tax=Stenotrophomonas panacihumi TaxID=676599 RepID=A0A0R0AC05_9GAMM|nr:SDR family oxidoreductase [Stenotrophomonas panacihumi]KRG38424.1 quinone oxidoreductase [Stenotrophomonas panacihumi]PTN54322.1 SDR family NAD(P)-dependent oxidoreductase [Stenotrophomonas panacihumi]
MATPRYLVTAATGQLGRLVVAELLQRVPATELAVAVRDPAKAADFAAQGVSVRQADYTDPASLEAAFAGIERVLLISSNAVGQRREQHRQAIDAAKRAGVKHVAYTSLLHADTSPLGLGEEHRDTETALRESGLAYSLLRNGWYTENLTGTAKQEVEHGVRAGSAAQGRFSTASRADYAAAAAIVLTSAHPAQVYELAGDDSFTLTEYAAALSRLSGKTVQYQDLPEAEYRQLLEQVGLPPPVAALLSDSDAGAAKGGLFDDSHTLSRLIGRATTSLDATLKAALQ